MYFYSSAVINIKQLLLLKLKTTYPAQMTCQYLSGADSRSCAEYKTYLMYEFMSQAT